ncbi:hypothetical protein MPTK1_1g13780 [Marchantia polymorpha subsp. ruderalis]|nr:hypothetical protein MARPO_0019s0148 [Marchantia polymorpha]BBM98470.1 hypothetical protein Mp_1g13780 [Marchantia polymorpha subsp. ruderalis]PTQ44741.1 hypothetical protein MARPO_0019s0148 [Marchantia polymorpha]PTQ44743.1 hypothetical protein MARPO_0019s0148 [Marchantia polymorpha]BBM98471.1 hypothetical protein Mp_1g13780 [Marchantia polymorpha subsp. ruderalis]|eukprot:PTQ44740.1 hypothetical protein MARPO_0019s0148 [Marchantia polymorpha]
MPSLRLSGLVRCFSHLNKLLLSFQLIVVLLLCPTQPTSMYVESAVTNGTYMLGFLSPNPGTNIPESLSIEWRSAFRVAVDVLNANRSYKFEPYMEDSDCTFVAAQSDASRMMRQEGLIGAVGPACSGAAIAAAMIFDQEGPAALVSFAATAEPLSNRTYYPTFFRTVYTDRHQAKAVVASMERLAITNATILYTNDYYSTNLASEINLQTAGGVRMVLLEPGYNVTVNKEQLKTILNSLKPSDFVILVVQPTVAQDIWKLAYQLDKIRYPWWYFGTDGATAFDPINIDQGLVSALEGEIGLAPYGGDFSANSQCSSFYMHWQEMADKYPGLPSLGANKSRSYVPYLFDAVLAFYKVVDELHEAGLEVTRLNVFKSFNASGKHQLRFNGCTGVVEFDPETGARSITAQPPVYDLVSMTLHSWELKGRITNESFVNLLPLERPGSYPAPGQGVYDPEPSGHKKASGGLIAGIVFLVVAILVLITACFVYYAKKCNSPMFNRL